MSLPEKIRLLLNAFIEDLKTRETVLGVGLFGSWSRGDAAPSSDVDLLIVEDRDFDYEYTERVEVDGFFLDLNYVPKQWITRVPPDIDQKIYELQILFDRVGSLSRAKSLVSKVYWRPERVEIRSESYLVEADSYMSRARLALGRGDYRSAKVNSVRSYWALAKIIIEAGKKPVSNSFFTRNFDHACRSLGMQALYENYIGLAGFASLSKANVKSMLDNLSSTWRDMMGFIGSSLNLCREIHPKISAKLRYYGHESFFKGLISRAGSLINESPVESANYIFHTLLDALESYVYMASLAEGLKFDYAALFKSLYELKRSPSEVYRGAINVLGVEEVSSQDAERAVKTVTEAALNVRQRRKDLIARL